MSFKGSSKRRKCQQILGGAGEIEQTGIVCLQGKLSWSNTDWGGKEGKIIYAKENKDAKS